MTTESHERDVAATAEALRDLEDALGSHVVEEWTATIRTGLHNLYDALRKAERERDAKEADFLKFLEAAAVEYNRAEAAEAREAEALRANEQLTIRHGLAIKYLHDFAPKAHEMFLNEADVRALTAPDPASARQSEET